MATTIITSVTVVPTKIKWEPNIESDDWHLLFHFQHGWWNTSIKFLNPGRISASMWYKLTTSDYLFETGYYNPTLQSHGGEITITSSEYSADKTILTISKKEFCEQLCSALFEAYASGFTLKK